MDRGTDGTPHGSNAHEGTGGGGGAAHQSIPGPTVQLTQERCKGGPLATNPAESPHRDPPANCLASAPVHAVQSGRSSCPHPTEMKQLSRKVAQIVP